MYYIYILKSKTNNKLYIGFTSDLRKRLLDHNNGKSNFTKKFIPWKLVYYEAYTSEKDAREKERQLKYHGKAWKSLVERINYSINES